MLNSISFKQSIWRPLVANLVISWQRCLPILYAATTPGVGGGVCVGPDGFMQHKGHPTLVRTSRTSRDTALAAQMWERSELPTGVHYAIESLAC
jgi:hypothetical protein